MKMYCAKFDDKTKEITREELRSLPEGTRWGWTEVEEIWPSAR